MRQQMGMRGSRLVYKDDEDLLSGARPTDTVIIAATLMVRRACGERLIRCANVKDWPFGA